MITKREKVRLKAMCKDIDYLLELIPIEKWFDKQYKSELENINERLNKIKELVNLGKVE